MIFAQNELVDTTDKVQEQKMKNPLLSSINKVLARVDDFKKLAKDFYFHVILSVHLCPECGGRIQLSGKSECTCECGNVFDPTLAFQRSPCCGQSLKRKTLHYVCSGCGKAVSSMFLFDERLFDNAYFRGMVKKSRSRAAKRKEEMNRILAESRSGALVFTDKPRLESIPGLIEGLDDFIGVQEPGSNGFSLDLNSDFKMEDYRNHILDILGADCFMFSDIGPLIDDTRRDRIWRFVTLIFMQNEREVVLTQYGNDFLVERISGEAY